MNAGASATHAATRRMAACGAQQPAWTVLDTGFGKGAHFLDIWQAWRCQDQRPALLHYVGVLSPAEALALPLALKHAEPSQTESAPLLAALARQCFDLEPGFHRLLLEGGQLSLTLCVGELTTVLARQEMQADQVLAAAPEQPWDKWQLKALARACKRGTELLFCGPQWPTAALLGDAGLVRQADAAPGTLLAQYQPRWALRRSPPSAAQAPERCCAVIGAGIAGASVARALALRGWQVDVYDTHADPAGGASGLPVGLVVPHHSADDSPRSRMSRKGTRLMLQHAHALLQPGVDWLCSGVLERAVDADGLADAEAEVLSHSSPLQQPTGWAQGWTDGAAHGLWHPHAAWIKPQRLVAQWLDHPAIRFHGLTPVHTLERTQGQWTLRTAEGAERGSADQVVLANAQACVGLLQRLAAAAPQDLVWVPEVLGKLARMQAMHGTLSMGRMPPVAADEAAAAGAAPDAVPRRLPTFPVFPVNGHGSLIAHVPTAQGPCWYAGSTFRTDALEHANLPAEHAANRAKLQALLPDAAQALSVAFDTAQVQAWQASRCITHDRLPLVGPLDDGAEPSLWMVAGMGARGLSFSALCAELLAAWMANEPLPLESTLARALSTRRPLRRKKMQPDGAA